MIEKFKKEGAQNVTSYIIFQKDYKGLSNVQLSGLLGVNASSVTKILQGKIQGVKAVFLYHLFVAFDLEFASLIERIYPGILRESVIEVLDEPSTRKRNAFGTFMFQFEKEDEQVFNLSKLTGIDAVRLDNLFYSDASLQAYELILIEKALGKAPGELFEMYFGSDTKSNK